MPLPFGLGPCARCSCIETYCWVPSPQGGCPIESRYPHRSKSGFAEWSQDCGVYRLPKRGRLSLRRATREEPNPIFLYIDFGTKAHALAFGSHYDAGTLHPAFVAFWASWFEGKEVPLWSTRLLLIEALEVVNSKDWKLLMELGTRSPPDQGANVVR
jgi:hypothetical protein